MMVRDADPDRGRATSPGGYGAAGAVSFPATPGWVLGSLVAQGDLIRRLVQREVAGRYRGSALGLLWSFFYPVLMLVVYTFVFSVVFRQRWSGGVDGQVGFAVMVFVGMIVHGLFSEVLTRAPMLVVSNPSYVKKIVFPLEALSWVSVGSALFHAAVSTLVLLGFVLLAQGFVPWTAVLFPVVLVPLVFFALGVSWFLASLGVYLRDVAQVVGVVSSVLLFLSPVFYPLSALPEAYRPLLLLNPLTPVIEQSRAVLVLGQAPAWAIWAAALVIGFAVAWLGLLWFQRTRRGFADVL